MGQFPRLVCFLNKFIYLPKRKKKEKEREAIFLVCGFFDPQTRKTHLFSFIVLGEEFMLYSIEQNNSHPINEFFFF